MCYTAESNSILKKYLKNFTFNWILALLKLGSQFICFQQLITRILEQNRPKLWAKNRNLVQIHNLKSLVC